MIKNYLKIAFRNLIRNKAYSLINILGLAVGMSACLLILLWVQDELSYDQFHPKLNSLFRVAENQQYADEIFQTPQTPSPLADVLKQDIPEIINATRVSFIGAPILFSYENKSFNESRGIYADNSFLEMFHFPIIKGNYQEALVKPNSIVLDREMAKKYFGTKNPIGKTLKLFDQHAFEVTGLIDEVPKQSHIQFSFIISTEFLKKTKNDFDQWGNNWLKTYVQLQPANKHQEVSEKIKMLIKEQNENSLVELFLQPVKDLHLRDTLNNRPGRIQSVYLLLIISLFILLIACINFMNLSTARSIARAKEVGLRKVIGATRNQLMGQFFGESLVLSSISMILAILLVEIYLPTFNAISLKELVIRYNDLTFIFLVLGVLCVTALTAGIYPALVLSAFQPVKVLKGRFHASPQGMRFRQFLVFTQFTVSIVLIISTALVFQQLQYVQNKSLGFDKENIIYIPLQDQLKDRYTQVKQELLKESAVQGVSAAASNIRGYGFNTGDFGWPGKAQEEQVLITFNIVDYDYFKTFGINLKAGRAFSPEFSKDTSTCIINQKSAEIMRLEDPIGTTIEFSGEKFKVIGVVDDFHFQSVRSEIDPLVVVLNRPNDSWMKEIYVKYQGDQLALVLERLEDFWKTYNPAYPFEYHFVDVDLERLYRSEKRLSRIFTYFAVLAIFISCLGLFGLATYLAQQRQKEMGIRKVLGAPLSNILQLMTSRFVLLIGLSFIIASPIAYYFTNYWLQSFAYRIQVLEHWAIFVMAGFMAVMITLLTVGFQAYKTALVNPIQVLKDE